MTWTFWLYAATCAPWAACLLVYGLRSPWRGSWTGRAQFTIYASLTAVLALAAALRVIDVPYWLAVTLAVCTLAAVCAAGVSQLINILRLQKERRTQPDCPHRRATDLP